MLITFNFLNNVVQTHGYLSNALQTHGYHSNTLQTHGYHSNTLQTHSYHKTNICYGAKICKAQVLAFPFMKILNLQLDRSIIYNKSFALFLSFWYIKHSPLDIENLLFWPYDTTGAQLGKKILNISLKKTPSKDKKHTCKKTNPSVQWYISHWHCCYHSLHYIYPSRLYVVTITTCRYHNNMSLPWQHVGNNLQSQITKSSHYLLIWLLMLIKNNSNSHSII